MKESEKDLEENSKSCSHLLKRQRGMSTGFETDVSYHCTKCQESFTGWDLLEIKNYSIIVED